MTPAPITTYCAPTARKHQARKPRAASIRDIVRATKGTNMTDYLPKVYQQFERRFPAVKASFDALGAAEHEAGPLAEKERRLVKDRKSTRLNSSHANISYADFCF